MRHLEADHSLVAPEVIAEEASESGMARVEEGRAYRRRPSRFLGNHLARTPACAQPEQKTVWLKANDVYANDC